MRGIRGLRSQQRCYITCYISKQDSMLKLMITIYIDVVDLKSIKGFGVSSLFKIKLKKHFEQPQLTAKRVMACIISGIVIYKEWEGTKVGRRSCGIGSFGPLVLTSLRCCIYEEYIENMRLQSTRHPSGVLRIDRSESFEFPPVTFFCVQSSYKSQEILLLSS